MQAEEKGCREKRLGRLGRVLFLVAGTALACVVGLSLWWVDGEAGSMFKMWFFPCLAIVGLLLISGRFWLKKLEESTALVSAMLCTGNRVTGKPGNVDRGSGSGEQGEVAVDSREIKTQSADHILRSVFRADLLPRLEVVKGLDAVCRSAAELIEEAHAEKREENRFITFYGSASLSTVDPERRRFGRRRERESEDEETQTPEQIYSGALEAAASDQVRIRRYIRLFTVKEFESRGRAVRKEYFEWIGNQAYQLGRNPNLRLTNSIRAPVWGGNISRIMSHRRVLEVVGDGDAGLLLVSVDLAETFRRQSRLSVLGGEGAVILPVHYGQTKPARTLEGEWATVRDFTRRELEPLKDALAAFIEEQAH